MQMISFRGSTFHPPLRSCGVFLHLEAPGMVVVLLKDILLLKKILFYHHVLVLRLLLFLIWCVMEGLGKLAQDYPKNIVWKKGFIRLLCVTKTSKVYEGSITFGDVAVKSSERDNVKDSTLHNPFATEFATIVWSTKT
ncbi:hypothetical protein TanjilG_22366 [Lupinus angustifolius]|uniref:Uncharacterized protein n=1 Tax=Lupinus angustifolius TaxID=3871 RepID=A0A4P1RSR8_LUPAN|nr:hypothetical protein TanjilG_22366 [Lupinus angustifolius]